MRRACATDANQAEIVAGLRKLGVKVACTHMVGGGFPDLCCAIRGVNVLLEVKLPKAKLNPVESSFHLSWPGPIAVVHDLDEALAELGILARHGA